MKKMLPLFSLRKPDWEEKLINELVEAFKNLILVVMKLFILFFIPLIFAFKFIQGVYSSNLFYIYKTTEKSKLIVLLKLH